jgi:hypothetical protein
LPPTTHALTSLLKWVDLPSWLAGGCQFMYMLIPDG